MQILRKGRKFLRLLAHPAWRTGLRHGVAAGVEHYPLLSSLEVATYVDIGANKGQFCLAAMAAHPSAWIYAFEPQPESVAKLKRATRGHPALEVFTMAVGADHGELELHITEREDNSSLLPASDRQLQFSPQARETRRESVPVAPLAAVLDAGQLQPPALLKIDVQGYEKEVLCGCGDLLNRFAYVYVELSLEELYVGQPRADEIIAMMYDAGLRLHGVCNPSFYENGRYVQADFLFRGVGAA